jgi:hypothetical protein
MNTITQDLKFISTMHPLETDIAGQKARRLLAELPPRLERAAQLEAAAVQLAKARRDGDSGAMWKAIGWITALAEAARVFGREA